MAPPQELNQLIEQFLDYVDHNPDHHLNMGRREIIYSYLGPHLFADEERNITGFIRRLKLASLSVEYVSPLWDKVWPNDKTVQDILSKIQSIIESPNNIQEENIRLEWETYWTYTTELTDSTREISGVVGMAAAAAFSLAISDGFMSEDDIDIEREDSEDFMFNDAHFYAAAAYSGGPPYEIAISTDSSSEKRRIFWHWWLKEAVPEAWQASQ